MGSGQSRAAAEHAMWAAWEERRKASVEFYEKAAWTKDIDTLAESLSSDCQVFKVTDSKAVDQDMQTPEGQHSGYDAARRRAWNHDCRGYPAVIIKVANADDIAKAVSFATKNDLPIAIAGGAHSNKAFVDQAYTIDTSLMRKVDVDVEAQTMIAEAGCLLGDLDAALKPHGLGCPWGTNPYTGIAGLCLTVGAGYLSRLHGFSIDNIIGFDAVLADGNQISATSDNENKDFFWANRGGCGNFGVITRFHFKVHKLPSNGNCIMYEVVYLKPTAGGATTVLKNASKLVMSMPDHQSGVIALPCGAPVVPTNWISFSDGLDTIGSIRPPEDLKAAGNLGGWVKVVSKCQVVSYHDTAQTYLIPHQPSALWYESAIFMKTLSDEVCETLVKFARKDIPNKLSAIVIFPLAGGGVSAADPANDAHDAPRDCEYWIIIEGRYDKKDGLAGREAVQEWVRKVSAALKALNGIETAHSFQASGPTPWTSKLDRLRELKTKYDPKNTFRMNRNIEPK